MNTSFIPGKLYSFQPREKWGTPWGGLEFRLKWQLNSGCHPLGREGMIFRRGERALRRGGGRGDRLWQSVWVWCGCLVSSPEAEVSLPWLMKFLREGSTTAESFCGGGFLFCQRRGVQRKPLPAFAGFSSAYSSKYTIAAYFGVSYTIVP